jgi:hypothetical protein
MWGEGDLGDDETAVTDRTGGLKGEVKNVLKTECTGINITKFTT